MFLLFLILIALKVILVLDILVKVLILSVTNLECLLGIKRNYFQVVHNLLEVLRNVEM